MFSYMMCAILKNFKIWTCLIYYYILFQTFRLSNYQGQKLVTGLPEQRLRSDRHSPCFKTTQGGVVSCTGETVKYEPVIPVLRKSCMCTCKTNESKLLCEHSQTQHKQILHQLTPAQWGSSRADCLNHLPSARSPPKGPPCQALGKQQVGGSFEVWREWWTEACW